MEEVAPFLARITSWGWGVCQVGAGGGWTDSGLSDRIGVCSLTQVRAGVWVVGVLFPDCLIELGCVR